MWSFIAGFGGGGGNGCVGRGGDGDVKPATSTALSLPPKPPIRPGHHGPQPWPEADDPPSTSEMSPAKQTKLLVL
ncbi:UNVERIFIED_CONTAM: hypothetical protein Sindi_1997600 [Sesamum indicum]